MIENAAKDLEFSATIRSGAQAIASGTTVSAADRLITTASVPAPRLWSVNSPNLYDVAFELRSAGKVLDRVQSYFGFRTVGTENGRVTLNDRPVYIKMVLD